ncbi:MAG: TlpA disulfide reductase family protein [Caldilineaceae bacterium]
MICGQGVVINFWASWCDPCRDEADLLEQTWLREKDNGIVFLGLDYLDQEPAAKAYLAEFNVTYPNGPDLRSEIARRYGIKGVPETFFINPQGNCRYRHRADHRPGADGSAAESDSPHAVR